MQKRAASSARRRSGPVAGGGKSARERVLAKATELFYRDGIRAVGIDTIIAESGVAKMSLYRNFASKDALAAAYLAQQNAAYWERWDRVVAAYPGNPPAQLRAIVATIEQRVTQPFYRGCPFSNAVTEFPEPDHPGRAVALANKAELRARLRALAAAVGARDPALLGDQLMLLIEGAYAAAISVGGSAVRGLTEAADALVAAATPHAADPAAKITRRA
ncbi:MAG: TetR family transcriptional regulator [Rhodospirillales bacterium]|jgi:AcrR family transcriptional regulator|nr:TetR family transcriptional regulator [Rhodospirillales bacterium]